MADDADYFMTVTAMAESCCRVFFTSRGVPAPTWEGLSGEAQDGWENVVIQGQKMLQEGAEHKWAELGARLCLAHQKMVSPESQSRYDGLAIPQQLAWEAVARHLVNLLGAIAIDDLGQAEAYWRDWLTGKQS